MMRHTRRIVLCGLGLCVASALGCTSGQRNVSTDKATDVGAEAHAQAVNERLVWADALSERVSKRRDRAWKRPPVWASREVEALDPPAREAPEGAGEEAALLFEALLGVRGAGFTLGAPARAKYAYYDEGKDELVFAAKAPREALEVALAAALGEALLAQYYEPGGGAGAWDAWLARRTLSDGEAMMAALLESLDTTADVSSDRPDLLERAPLVRSWALGHEGDIGSSVHGFTHRVGLGMVNAMYRSQGWSGVELLSAAPPEATVSAARHGEWMNGQAAPRWTWPTGLDDGMARQGLEIERSGSAGATTIAAIVEANGATITSLALAMAMRGDHYVSYAGDGERVVVWASQWETPTVAVEAQAQVEKLLAAREGGGRRSRVWRDGLDLVVAVALESPDAPLEIAERALDATVEFPARGEFPVAYTNSATEKVLLGRELASYDADDGAWSEPTLGVKMDLSALGDGWKVDLNDRGLLRWFARREGQLVQLSVELSDPLAEDGFEAPEYASNLAEAMGKAIPGATAKAEHTAYPFGKVIEVRVDGAAERMRVVHFRKGTILFTYSVRGPAEEFDALWRSAAGALSTLQGLSTGAPGDGEGTPEYTIEP